MPDIFTSLFTIDDIENGAITQGEIEIANSVSLDYSITGWEDMGLSINIDIPSNCRAILMINHNTIDSIDTRDVEYAFRFNIDNGAWTSPEQWLVVDTRALSETSQLASSADDSMNIYLLKDTDSGFPSGLTNIKVQYTDIDVQSAHNVFSELVVAALKR
ncbi:MAG: hypothetical protein ACQEQF_00315 [Bacillota bacterium]